MSSSYNMSFPLLATGTNNFNLIETVTTMIQQPNTAVSPLPPKKEKNQPGNSNPDAEVIALSPKTIMSTNRFLCEVCNKGFNREQNLQFHGRVHNRPWLKQKSEKEVTRKVYICPEPTCVHHDPSRALGDFTRIKKHYYRKHGEKQWKCEKCPKSYALQSDWKTHSKICGTNLYRCDCGTSFCRRANYNAHMTYCDTLNQDSERNPTVSFTETAAAAGGSGGRHDFRGGAPSAFGRHGFNIGAASVPGRQDFCGVAASALGRQDFNNGAASVPGRQDFCNGATSALSRQDFNSGAASALGRQDFYGGAPLALGRHGFNSGAASVPGRQDFCSGATSALGRQDFNSCAASVLGRQDFYGDAPSALGRHGFYGGAASALSHNQFGYNLNRSSSKEFEGFLPQPTNPNPGPTNFLKQCSSNQGLLAHNNQTLRSQHDLISLGDRISNNNNSTDLGYFQNNTKNSNQALFTHGAGPAANNDPSALLRGLPSSSLSSVVVNGFGQNQHGNLQGLVNSLPVTNIHQDRSGSNIFSPHFGNNLRSFGH